MNKVHLSPKKYKREARVGVSYESPGVH